jgi:hypothetical protein
MMKASVALSLVNPEMGTNAKRGGVEGCPNRSESRTNVEIIGSETLPHLCIAIILSNPISLLDYPEIC